MEKRIKFRPKIDGFFLVGFFLVVFFLLADLFPAAAFSVLIMIFPFVYKFEWKRFFARDLFMIGYACSTLLVVLSYVTQKWIAFGLGIFGMIFSIFMFFLYKTVQLHKKKKEKAILRTALKKKSLPKKKFSFSIPAHLPDFISLLAVLALIGSVLLKKVFLFYTGLGIAAFALSLQMIHIRKAIKNLKLLRTKRIEEMKLAIKRKKYPYETDFDKIMLLVETYKTIKLSEAAHVFNISREKAEHWGHVLEEHLLLRVHYPALGEIELQWNSPNTK
ncbi:hypothetical protein HZB00_03200 [Candidatus Woesearchaeota archaeon]|nr:hypothetical protein [Candidatus Woesearchaeota archaeon]